VLRVTLDTNIYVSGLNYRGNPYRTLELAREGKILVAVSDEILDEVERVLQEKFHWPHRRAQQARRDIRDFAEHVTPSSHLNVIKEDPDDDRILECAAAARSDYIVTGDNHLLKLQSFGSIKMIKSAGFLDVVQEAGRHSR
jgi:uncharacterized protein